MNDDSEDYALITEYAHDGQGVIAVDLALCRAPTRPMPRGQLSALVTEQRTAARERFVNRRR